MSTQPQNPFQAQVAELANNFTNNSRVLNTTLINCGGIEGRTAGNQGKSV